MELPGALFKAKLEKLKQFSLKKVLIEFSGSNIKKFLIFSQKKAFLIFRETDAPQKTLYISGNGTFLYFRERRL